MASIQNMHKSHMKCAFIYANLSSCNKKKVGCLVVKGGTPIAIGYNGTPSGWDNCCEDRNGKTKSSVQHAEANALNKLAQSTISATGAVLYVTLAPCIYCAKQIQGAGITEVFYANDHKMDGIDYLKQCGISVTKLTV